MGKTVIEWDRGSIGKETFTVEMITASTPNHEKLITIARTTDFGGDNPTIYLPPTTALLVAEAVLRELGLDHAIDSTPIAIGEVRHG